MVGAAAALGYGPLGGPWHNEWGTLPTMLQLLAVPCALGLLATVITLGRAVSNGLAKRTQRPVAPPVVPGGPTLASENERDRASERVAAAMGEARLGLEEGVQRLDAIWQARHRHEVDTLVADLPAVVPPPPRRRLGAGALLSLALAGLAVLVQTLFGLWELWPLSVAASLGVVLFRRR